jgi:hypothetical protein
LESRSPNFFLLTPKPLPSTAQPSPCLTRFVDVDGSAGRRRRRAERQARPGSMIKDSASWPPRKPSVLNLTWMSRLSRMAARTTEVSLRQNRRGRPGIWVALNPSRPVRRGAVIIAMPSVLDPLPDVARHVVEPERVRLERADGRGLPKIPPACTAVAVRFALAGTAAPRVASDRACARGDRARPN